MILTIFEEPKQALGEPLQKADFIVDIDSGDIIKNRYGDKRKLKGNKHLKYILECLEKNGVLSEAQEAKLLLIRLGEE